MINRMSTNQVHLSSLNVILEAQARLQRTQEELASGKRILSPSDDAVATAQIMQIQSELSRVETFQRNISTARSDLAFTESTVTSIEDVLMRARELAVRANSATMTTQDRAIIADEIDGLREQLLSLSNTKTASGEYLFSGFASSAEAFADTPDPTYDAEWLELSNGVFVDTSYLGSRQYQGDSGERAVNIAPGMTMSTRFNGQSVFGTTVFDAESSELDAFEALALMSNAIRGSEPSPPEGLGSALMDDTRELIPDGLEAIDTALDRVSSVRTDIGVKLNRLDDQQLLNDTFNVKLQETMSDLEDLDYAKAITEMNLRMVALEAAQQAYTKTQGLSLFNYL